MNVHFISASQPLTKKFSRLPDGTIEKTSYLNAYLVTSHEERASNLTEFYAHIQKHAALGHCLLKGTLYKPLVNQSRAHSTTPDTATSFVCLDIDGVPSKYSIDTLLLEMGLQHVSYVLQWSASQGITNPDTNRCHIFMMLAAPTAASQLKQWLIQMNFQAPALIDSMTLTKTGLGLSYGLDITACQNDKLLYIAPPILEGIKIPLGRRPRYELVKKANDFLTLPAKINSLGTNRALVYEQVRKLRAANDMPVQRMVMRTYKDVEVLSKPEQATLTGIRRDPGYTHLNLNGGDSWGYWHPEDNFEIIYNFKGEPLYATKELLPEYYAECKREAALTRRTETESGAFAVDDKQPVLLAFRDNASGAYRHGSYDPLTDVLNLATARSEKQVRDFCMQFNMPIGDFIPIWDMVFEPNNPKRVDVDARRINMFQLSPYMLAGKARKTPLPRTIHKIMRHILADDQAAINHLINWLAYLVQKRERPTTGWVWYGTEGTGKGVFASRVLRPLFGVGQTAMRRGDELSQPYNNYMQNTMLVFFDEAHVAEMKDAEYVMAKLRNFITEPTVSLRMMHSNAMEIPNYAGIICLSNKPNVITLQKQDRRWNIGPFQHEKLSLTDKEIHELIPSELQAFYDFLLAWNLDEDAARTPLVSNDRDRLIGATTSSADEVAEALYAEAGSMEFFLDQLPTNVSGISATIGAVTLMEYRNLLRALIIRGMTEGSGRVKIARDELHVLFEYTVGNMPKTPNKFTKFLMHRHIHTEKVRIDKPVYGIAVMFKDYVHFAEYLRDYFPDPKLEVVKPVKRK